MVAGKIDAGRLRGIEQGGECGDFAEAAVGDLMVLEPAVEDVSAERWGQGLQFRDGELVVCGEGFGEAAEESMVLRGHRRGPEQSRAEITSGGAAERGNRFEAEAVPERVGNGVAGIFAEPDFTGSGPGGEFGPGQPEQRPAQCQGFPAAGWQQAADRFHATESGTATQQVGENGFDLVIGMMGQKNRPAADLACAGSEEAVTFPASGRFEGKATGCGNPPYIR